MGLASGRSTAFGLPTDELTVVELLFRCMPWLDGTTAPYANGLR
jgi:hypothetical protein